ncbi:interferon lambda-2-like [Rhinophrynus dorsalis]
MDILIRLGAVMVLLVAVSGHPHRRHCHMSRYRSISPSDMRAVRLLQREHEERTFTDGVKCHKKMMRHKPSVCDLRASDRLILTLERVTLTVDVLTNITTSSPSDNLSQPLDVFLALEEDLKFCRMSPVYSDPPSHQLRPWLHHLQHFREKVTLECVQHSVLLSLTHLLMDDVTCWANSE